MTRELESGRREATNGTTKSVVVFLHGYGANGDDLLGLAEPLSRHLPDTTFYAPDAPDPVPGHPFGRQWFPIPRFDGSSEAEAKAAQQTSSDDLQAYLDKVLEDEGIRPEKLALFGFSQGTMMSLHVAPRRAQKIAGVVAFSGRLLAPERLQTEAQSKPPVILIHGDADPVVPFAELELAGEALIAAGFETYAHVMKGTGHGIAPDGLSVAVSFLKDRLG